MINPTFDDIINHKITITYNTYKDVHFYFFEPMLDSCLKYENNGDIDDNNTSFIGVIVHPEHKSDCVIVTTKRTYDQRSIDIQNIETSLKSIHDFENVHTVFSEPKDIHAILHDKNSILNANNSSKKEILNTEALQDLHNIVTKAVNLGTSDIHFYVDEDRAEVVFEVDGLFLDPLPLARQQAISIVNAGLSSKSPNYTSLSDDDELIDVTIELNIEVLDKNKSSNPKLERIRLRTSKTGALNGPHTVCRIIRTAVDSQKDIHSLGFDNDLKKLLIDSVNAPSGIVLLTGPTGSGKSTTLAALYQTIDENRKIILLEDPVEYAIYRKNTIQKSVVPDEPGKGFLEHLKAALRQRPDIIGISEIRSKEVAEIVVKSSKTGHLMISTLHTNDAIGAISRLIDEGISPKILSEINLLTAVSAQRLVPRLCEHCKIPHKLDGFSSAFIKKKHGCNHCDNKGTRGRIQISEVIVIDYKCREFIRNYDLNGLRNHLENANWKGMRDRARMRIEQGLIDPFEAQFHITNVLGDEEMQTYEDVDLAILQPAS